MKKRILDIDADQTLNPLLTANLKKFAYHQRFTTLKQTNL